MARKADVVARRRNSDGDIPIEAEVFELGHWEAMQMGLALDMLADSMNELEELDQKLHTRDLARVFQGDALFQIVRKPVAS